MSGAPGLQDHNSATFTSGGLLARNTLYNLIGQGAPLLVAIFSIPFLIKGLGTDRFGILTLAWMVIGYFSIFDLGLGRALTKLVAEKLGEGQEQEISALVWTALFLMLLLGLVAALVLSLLSPWLVRDALKIPEALQSETLHAFYLLALSVPVVISTAGLRGVLEAQQRFGLIAAVHIPGKVYTFVGPLLILPFSQSLFPVVFVLMVGSLIIWLVYLLLCLYVMPVLRHRIAIQRKILVPLLRFGSWMTVSNTISPLMVTMDRFLLGALISTAAVAYYATPYEMVTKLWVISGSVAGVLFPAFSFSFLKDRGRTAMLFSRGVKYVFLALFPITLFIVTLAREILGLWLGNEFAQNSTCVLQWLAIGVFINSLGQIAFALVHGAGRPDLTAKIHFIELPIYLLTFWLLVGSYGLIGAAIAWMVRVALDTLLLFAIAKRFLTISIATIWCMIFAIGGALFILAFASLPIGLTMKGFFLLFTLITFALFTWNYILDDMEKQNICFVFNRATAEMEKIK
ncbi:MAG: flippase [Dehalococcoidia bacterium]|jgi:O-antigen/teichoic acid export membrane protein|nr:MAG: flippase [Dehalococcoidia bacterium]